MDRFSLGGWKGHPDATLQVVNLSDSLAKQLGQCSSGAFGVNTVRPEQSLPWADYRETTLQEQGRLVTPASFAVTVQGVPVAYSFCFVCVDDQGERRVVSNGDLLTTYACTNLLSECSDEAFGVLLDYLSFIAQSHDANCEVVIESRHIGAGIRWAEDRLPPSAVSIRSELTVDLSRSLTEIWSSVRKSYRPLIKGLRWNLDVALSPLGLHSALIDWGEFRALHRLAAGRATRGDESWACQLDAMRQGGGFLVMARLEGRLVGAGAFGWGVGRAEYGTGAYDRELMAAGFPLGHKVQWAAIEYMKSRGVQIHSLGLLPDEPSTADSGVLGFKRGFGATPTDLLILRIGTSRTSSSLSPQEQPKPPPAEPPTV